MNNGVIVAGAGFTGATAARVLAEHGYRVFVLEARDVPGGNAADTPFNHPYGPHIFHTNSDRVFDFLSAFTDWRPYEHKVTASIEGVGRVPLPVNFATIEALYSEEIAEMSLDRLVAAYGRGSSVPILRLRGGDDPVLAELGEDLWRTFFEGYTRKMWGRDPEELSPGVTGRVPIRLSRDDRYFTDRFQAQPAAGYAALFERMLDHPNINLHLEDRFELYDVDGPVVYTGPVDRLFAYAHGALEYRSMEFIVTRQDEPVAMPYAATTNYPGTEAFTRETEMGVVTGSGVNLILREIPMPHSAGLNDPYYPVPTPGSRDRWHDYEREAAKRGIVLAGRLAEYKYLNMDQAVAAGLKAAEKITGVRS